MRIVEMTAHIVELPLRKEIKHASHARRRSTNLVVCCRLADGTEGWGEGVPRPYVTGESPEGAMEQLALTPLGEQLDVDCQTWDDVLRLCGRFEPADVQEDPRGCRGNSVRCAVELSLLDAFGRLFGEPVSTVTHRFAPARPLRVRLPGVRYSGAVTAESRWRESVSALKMRAFGFAHCKVKVGVAATNEERRLGRIRRWLGRRMDVRLDANGAWRGSELVGKLAPLVRHRISCVEQPVPHDEVEALAEVRRQVPVPVMLDESLTSLADAQHAVRRGTCDLFNIRLSKCGGFLNSLRLAAVAHENGLGYQLGCHPGESGILSAAGRHWATSVRDVRYCEGSYDRHLLQDRLTEEDLTFGYGGRAAALARPGLGITVRRDVLARLVTCRQTFRWD